jgi:hypothetical protein
MMTKQALKNQERLRLFIFLGPDDIFPWRHRCVALRSSFNQFGTFSTFYFERCLCAA